jgi:hypothetical protein
VAGLHDDTIKDCTHSDKIKYLEEQVNRVSLMATKVEADLQTSVLRQVSIEGELKLLSHKLEDNELRSRERHNINLGISNEIKESLADLRTQLKYSGETSYHQINTLTAPLQASLQGLYSRWWTMATALIVMLSGGVVSLVVYIWQSQTP